MNNEYINLVLKTGFSPKELSKFHNVRIRTVNKWLKNKRPVPNGCIVEIEQHIKGDSK